MDILSYYNAIEKEEKFKKGINVMWKKVIQISKRDPSRFTKKLGTWAGRNSQKGWHPKDINETLELCVQFEDGHSKIREWYPYLNRILQAKKTKEQKDENKEK